MTATQQTDAQIILNFEKRATQMGLNPTGNGLFYHQDRFGKVAYRTLYTSNDETTVASGQKIPAIALFTSGPKENDKFEFRTVLSQFYNFIGNENVITRILEAISALGTQVFHENFIVSPDYTQLYYEAVIRNPKNVPNLGEVYPQITIRNSYNGTLKQTLAFGISLNQSTTQRLACNFRNTLGNFSQKHHESARTITVGLGRYISAFNEGIDELFTENLNRMLSVKDVLATLDMVQEVGLKRRQEVSIILGEYDDKSDQEKPPMSAWNLFLAILKYTSAEQNINAKVLLENIAEKTLILPSRMLTALKVNS